ncbi:hypothetical protein ACQEVF_24770 [Nonomuraea polychroma]|uniref:hypothetical protein n=1 Tax=Nonomuraea polychroma TaxID=46176 RepID=UPI003D9047A3
MRQTQQWTGQERATAWTLSARRSAVPAARRMAAARLTAWHLPALAQPVALLAGHLIADALRHSADRIRLTLWAEDGLLRCEIGRAHQPGTTSPQPTGPLHALLERLACCWGAQDGVIWFELRLEARP